ncbi:hypothetical protein DEJ23_10610 [Curtobacterium sp. MCSS17_008]|uniref:hypothetical protein n=1 Tax=Curtobacterium sp. MCSS17_008 TaxID=2175647 RepID=UPI000DA7DA97|nr:hypothetical protein [Curtobacterium sp. MCSS17_008]PZF56311.1 hypothetical protein DEJ23_10610 [Curtobacterium sp. MCSS17_008]
MALLIELLCSMEAEVLAVCQSQSMICPKLRLGRGAAALTVTLSLSFALVGCAQQEADPLEVTNTTTINDITDNTDTGYYTVDSAVLNTTSFGTELTLGFTIINSNGIKFSPVSTITFSDGTRLTCEADDPRRVPSLVDTTDSWGFACDAADFPTDGDGATLTVVDDYN